MATRGTILCILASLLAVGTVQGDGVTRGSTTSGSVRRQTIQPARSGTKSPFGSSPFVHRQKTRSEKLQDKRDAEARIIKQENNETNPVKLCAIGLKYQLGLNDTDIDKDRAMEMYQKAAAMDCAEAQCRIGLMYEAGEGVGQDYDMAAAWFKKAARQDHDVALLHLGVCYMEGRGVAKDMQKAVKNLRKAARQYPDAGYILGTIYEFGREDVAPDPAEAKKWYKVALNSKHPENVAKANEGIKRLRANKQMP